MGETAPATGSLVRVHRPELQGLRAVAVTLVVVYHVWFGRVSGGVDVFFVVSGFLLTGQLARAADQGPLALGRRWSRTLVRLLPSAVVVLVATAAAGMLVLPEGRWSQTLHEVVAAAVFLENWQLAADAVDYAARSNMSSPVQHFWSLSIQGQFFLVWPLLVALVALAARGDAARMRAHLTVTTVGVFVVSLTFSVALTATNQPLAYFHSLTRLWEFALGGLLALTIDGVRLRQRTRVRLGWVGLVGLLACGAVLRVGSVFPGAAALWPTGCAVLVLLAGRTGARWGVDRLLTARPLRYVGDLSYPLYLWHWPVLVFCLVLTGRDRLDLATGAGVVALSVVLAVLTHHLVEEPVPRLPGGGFRVAVAGLAAVFLAAGLWQVEAMQQAQGAGEVGDIRYPGALALAVGEPEPAPLLPPPVSVYDDWVRIENWDCVPMTRFPMDACTRPVESPQRRIVVVGDSHTQQLAGLLVPIAERHGWQLTVIARGACPFSTASEVVAGRAGLPGVGGGRDRRDRGPAAGCGGHAGQPRRPGRADRADTAGVRRPLAAAGAAGHPGAGDPGQPAVRPVDARLRAGPADGRRRPGCTGLRGGPGRGVRRRATVDTRAGRPAERPVPRYCRPRLRPGLLPGGDRQRAGLPGRQPPDRVLLDLDGTVGGGRRPGRTRLLNSAPYLCMG